MSGCGKPQHGEEALLPSLLSHFPYAKMAQGISYFHIFVVPNGVFYACGEEKNRDITPQCHFSIGKWVGWGRSPFSPQRTIPSQYEFFIFKQPFPTHSYLNQILRKPAYLIWPSTSVFQNSHFIIWENIFFSI